MCVNVDMYPRFCTDLFFLHSQCVSFLQKKKNKNKKYEHEVNLLWGLSPSGPSPV